MTEPTDLKGAFYVTGPAGAGKTTLTANLTKLGYHALDVDNGIGNFTNQDGTIVPTAEAHPENEAWAESHQWAINSQALHAELNRFKNSHIFICGATRNQYDYLRLFTKVLYLDVTHDEAAQRVQHERDHSYGKYPFQLKKILDDIDGFRIKAREVGAVFVDVQQSPEKVVTDVLTIAAAK